MPVPPTPAADPRGSPHEGLANASGRIHRAPLGVTDGKGVMFVGHTGEIYPAGFLPVMCGRFPQDSVVEVYQKHPLFLALRNPDRFKGKCGVCEYRYVCGGSRARAFAVTGDPLESEPDCVYHPRADAAPLPSGESPLKLGLWVRRNSIGSATGRLFGRKFRPSWVLARR